MIVNAAAYTAVDRAETERGRRARRRTPRRPACSPRRRSALRRAAGALTRPTTCSTATQGSALRRGPIAATRSASTARTKLEGERAIAAAACRHLILRTSWVYGPRGRNFLLHHAAARARARPSCAWSTTSAARPPRAAQLARLVRELLDRGGDTDELTRAEVDEVAAIGGIYHATAAGETTWFGFAQAIFDELPRAAAPRLHARRASCPSPPRLPDARAAARELGALEREAGERLRRRRSPTGAAASTRSSQRSRLIAGAAREREAPVARSRRARARSPPAARGARRCRGRSPGPPPRSIGSRKSALRPTAGTALPLSRTESSMRFGVAPRASP